jgi:hypothetical protein
MRAAGVAMGGGVLRACAAVLDLLQIGAQRVDQEMRQGKGKIGGPRGGGMVT